MPTALITGATSGIGAEFSRELARRGYRLVIVARDEQRLTAFADQLRTQWGAPAVEVLAADLSDPDGQDAVVTRLLGEPIDLLVNNAGKAVGKAFQHTTSDEILEQLELNVTAVMVLTHAALAGMTSRDHGGIINVASVAGMVPGRGSTYAASKAWVIAFTEGLSVACKGTGVRVQALCPGFVRTEFHQRADIDMSTVKDWMYVDVELLVQKSLADLRANRPISVPGALYKTITTAARLAPRSWVRAIANKVDSAPRT